MLCLYRSGSQTAISEAIDQAYRYGHGLPHFMSSMGMAVSMAHRGGGGGGGVLEFPLPRKATPERMITGVQT